MQNETEAAVRRTRSRLFLRRALARLVDLGLYYVLTEIIINLGFRIAAEPLWRSRLLAYALPVVLMLVIEPFLLKLTGRTFGKVLLGIRVTDDTGGRLTYKAAFVRTLHILYEGLGLWVPLFNFIRMMQVRSQVVETGEWPWDRQVQVSLSGRGWVRAAAVLAGVLALTGSWVIVSAVRQMPLHRGAISSEQYVQNVNDLIRRLSPGYGAVLLPDGTWSEDEAVTEDPRWQPLPAHILTETDGRLTRVVMSARSSADQTLFGYLDQKGLAYVAFVGADPRYTWLVLQNDPVMLQLQDAWSTFTDEKFGVSISQTVAYAGYEKAGRFLMPVEGADRFYDWEFSLTLDVAD